MQMKAIKNHNRNSDKSHHVESHCQPRASEESLLSWCCVHLPLSDLSACQPHSEHSYEPALWCLKHSPSPGEHKKQNYSLKLNKLNRVRIVSQICRKCIAVVEIVTHSIVS